MIRVVLADDHAMFREGLRSKFARCPEVEVIGEAGSGEELLELLKTESPDVLVLDIKMPDTNGISLLPRVKTLRPHCQCVVLTMYDHARYAVHALESGANGFVVKGSAFEELLQAVQEARQGRTYVSSAMAPKLADRLRKKDREQFSLDQLSQREFEVLTLLSGGLSVKDAAEQMGISQKTVSTYRARVMEKMNLHSKTDLIRFAIETGLID